MYPIDLLADGTKINGIDLDDICLGLHAWDRHVRWGDANDGHHLCNLDGTWVYGAYAGASATFENGSGFSQVDLITRNPGAMK
jgi:hypothetical protein